MEKPYCMIFGPIMCVALCNSKVQIVLQHQQCTSQTSKAAVLLFYGNSLLYVILNSWTFVTQIQTLSPFLKHFLKQVIDLFAHLYKCYYASFAEITLFSVFYSTMLSSKHTE